MQTVGPEAEVSCIRSELTTGEWTFRDARHRGFVLESGSGRVVLQHGELSFVAPSVVWLPVGAGASLVLNAGSRGISIALSQMATASAITASAVASQMRAALSQPIVHSRLDGPRARRLSQMLSAIGEEISRDLPAALEAQRYQLGLFLIETWRLSGPVLLESKPLPRLVVQRFLHAVELHFREHWTIARYAREVGVTPDRLNATVVRAAGHSPLGLIHKRLMHEADALLDHSSLQVAEIAAELGFSDAAYFSRFYKRLAGRSPNSQRREIVSPDASGSFAAWP